MTTATQTTAPAGATLTGHVDELFAKADQPGKPGAAVGVIRGDELVLERYYGLADLEHDVPISASTVFDIASTSKQFTAATMVLLERAGALSLDDEVQAYVPELPQYEAPISIRQLIHHTSGLRDYLGLRMLAGLHDVDAYTTAEVLQLLAQQRGLNFSPGARHSYCNSGYLLLGVIVTRVTGGSFREFVRASITEPLGMTSSFFRDDPFEVIPGLVRGYTLDGDRHRKADSIDGVLGDGGFISNLRDLARWNGNFISEQVGGPGFTSQMETVGTPDGDRYRYAFGLSITAHRGHRVVGHGGSLYGYQGEFIRFPDDGFSVIVMGNQGGFDSSGLALKVADLLLENDEQATSTVAPTAPAPETPLADLTGLFMHDESGLAFDLVLDDARLVLQVRDLTLPMKRVDGDRFVTDHEVYNLEGWFEDDGTGTLLLKMYNAGELFMDLHRIPRQEPGRVHLDDYPGRYSSGELGVPFDITGDGDHLYVWRPLAGRDALRPTVSDEFAAPWGRLRFTRAIDGSVNGLLADTSRATGVMFIRV